MTASTRKAPIEHVADLIADRCLRIEDADSFHLKATIWKKQRDFQAEANLCLSDPQWLEHIGKITCEHIKKLSTDLSPYTTYMTIKQAAQFFCSELLALLQREQTEENPLTEADNSILTPTENPTV